MNVHLESRRFSETNLGSSRFTPGRLQPRMSSLGGHIRPPVLAFAVPDRLSGRSAIPEHRPQFFASHRTQPGNVWGTFSPNPYGVGNVQENSVLPAATAVMTLKACLSSWLNGPRLTSREKLGLPLLFRIRGTEIIPGKGWRRCRSEDESHSH